MTGIFPSKGRRWAEGNWFQRHSLSIVLISIFIIQSIVFHFTALPVWEADQIAHGESVGLWPGYWQYYIAEWFVSVLADTYGALLLVLLTKWFYEEGSAESE